MSFVGRTKANLDWFKTSGVGQRRKLIRAEICKLKTAGIFLATGQPVFNQLLRERYLK